MKTKIYMVDDHDIVTQGLSLYLKGEERFEIIGKAETGEKALLDLQNLEPNILILDIKLSGMQGFEIAEEVRKKYPEIKIIFLSSNTDEESLNRSISVGGRAYLSKDVQKNEFLLALVKVCSGDTYYSTGIQDVVYNKYNKQQTEKIGFIPLSDREIEVIKLFVDGCSYKEIANQLAISARTVETHKKNILKKLKLKTTVDLVKYAIKQGIISL